MRGVFQMDVELDMGYQPGEWSLEGRYYTNWQEGFEWKKAVVWSPGA